jgi:hypothetical protein
MLRWWIWVRLIVVISPCTLERLCLLLSHLTIPYRNPAKHTLLPGCFVLINALDLLTPMHCRDGSAFVQASFWPHNSSNVCFLLPLQGACLSVVMDETIRWRLLRQSAPHFNSRLIKLQRGKRNKMWLPVLLSLPLRSLIYVYLALISFSIIYPGSLLSETRSSTDRGQASYLFGFLLAKNKHLHTWIVYLTIKFPPPTVLLLWN